jgi:hypothetical protein
MDHDVIVEQLLARCYIFIANIWQATDLHSVATAALAIFAPLRQVGREILQAKIHVAAQQLKGTAVIPCCQTIGARFVHTRTVSPQTVLGEVHIPVRTLQCGWCGGLMDRVGQILSALKLRRPWKKTVRDALAQLIGYVERHRTRLRYQLPWDAGLAVGSGAGEGACKHVIQSRLKRAGRRWKPLGILNVLVLRSGRLNRTFQAFWAGRGLAIQAWG